MIDKNHVAFENRIRLHETKCPSPDYLTLLLFYLEFGEHCVFVMEILWRRCSAAKIVLDSGN
jgi:hypothetical protein